MSEKKNNGDFITFLMQKKYVMVNNNLGAGSFGKTVLLNRIIYMQTVTDFVKWFEGYSLESQKLILRNFATKLSTIKLIKPEVEIPF